MSLQKRPPLLFFYNIPQCQKIQHGIYHLWRLWKDFIIGEAQTKGTFDLQILFQFAEPQHLLNIFDLESLTTILLKINSPCKQSVFFRVKLPCVFSLAKCYFSPAGCLPIPTNINTNCWILHVVPENAILMFHSKLKLSGRIPHPSFSSELSAS